HMHDSTRQRHDRQYKMRSSGSHMNREIEQTDQCRHVNDAAADAKQAADKTHQEADADAVPDIEFVMMLFPAFFSKLPFHAFAFVVPAGITALLGFQDEEHGDHDQQRAENDVERMS